MSSAHSTGRTLAGKPRTSQAEPQRDPVRSPLFPAATAAMSLIPGHPLAFLGCILVVLHALGAAAQLGVTERPRCRCLPPQPCWSAVPWKALNTSVGGRLHRSVDELAACLPREGGDLKSAGCAAALNKTDDEFWISAQPNGYLHTGLFNEWNTAAISEYSVLAETEDDFAATTKFAHDHNLRLVVKGTGHDWYGRSTSPGSLLLWTHQRKNMTWYDAFVAEGCSAATSFPAVRVQSGVQFRGKCNHRSEHLSQQGFSPFSFLQLSTP